MPNEDSTLYEPSSAIVIGLTLLLFLVSVFVKGFTHELLLEAGVFLVSVKLILMAQKNSVSAKSPASAWNVSRLCWNRFKTSHCSSASKWRSIRKLETRTQN